MLLGVGIPPFFKVEWGWGGIVCFIGIVLLVISWGDWKFGPKPVRLNLGGGLTAEQPPLTKQRQSYIKLARPYVRTCFACSDSYAFRECRQDHDELVVLTLALFNCNAPIASAQLLYEGSDGMVRTHGCWLGQAFGSVKGIPGTLCELILAVSSMEDGHLILDDKSTYKQPAAIVPRHYPFREPVTVTVFTYLGDDEGPTFGFHLADRDGKLTATPNTSRINS